MKLISKKIVSVIFIGFAIIVTGILIYNNKTLINKSFDTNLRPKYHFTPKSNWLNDPNGLCYYNGSFHLYYQYNPFAPCWGAIHWGHATSKDMLNWKYEDIALKYDNEYDKDGCFSGSAIEKDGKLHIFYTGVQYHKIKYNEYNIPIQEDPNGFTPSQIHAFSEDGGYSFKKILPPSIMPIKDNQMRDPKVFKTKEGFYRMVLGDTEDYKKGSIVFYKSEDLNKWEFEGKWTSDKFGWGWECPDFFDLNNNDVLIFSPMGAGTKEYPNIAMYLTGQMDFSNFNFNIESKGLLDESFEMYAPQTFNYYDEKKQRERRIMIGWIRMSKPFDNNNNFCGMMTIPRECFIENGIFKTYPIEEFNSKRKGRLKDLKNTKNLYDIEFKIKDNFNMTLFADSSKKGLYLNYDKNNSLLTIDRKDVKFEGISGAEKIEIKIDLSSDIRIIADVSVIEIFINKGEKSCSFTVYPLGENIFIENDKDMNIYNIY
ncbi:glycosyl hydrolase family 32 domain-containing protein [Brachyspira hampsonii 30446]|uniref:beta-fructofuranosidase n=1 Tax=Brachyspira hampsonii 30446 TaxID=1289135 RepID=A0A2U4EWH1_9SPIR|nr:GH32 C-terminal domain-containing protein [Brachyspira hampsonii]EKV57376.1 glycosyl hydrolase family 32 domain-containing protein [Brachyspira hampsonii 30446]MBW5395273.1 glycoside hydrolase family 32 protein [Brachyspira hampsonii]OEJ20524.1 glycosyl hydrolase family 32 [Brachyspira hampsonii]